MAKALHNRIWTGEFLEVSPRPSALGGRDEEPSSLAAERTDFERGTVRFPGA
ncbi:hypothetical protein AB0D38_23690 [Streptomyces sp. NPDC048279]|uniref:hypothetical protein n=1 Tax=Streptomyces sp. NPDC048279 TaxID=3154714 RepID=UPI0034286525